MLEEYLKMHLEFLPQGAVLSIISYYNTDCIDACRWRIFRRPIIAKPENVVIYTKAAIALHNYLRTVEGNRYLPPGSVDGEDGSGNVIQGTWREEATPVGLEKVGSVGGNR